LIEQSSTNINGLTPQPDPNEQGRVNGYPRLTIEILQFMVGALVTMGGSLFAILAVDRFGTVLGLIHLSLGITGLLAGIAFLQVKSWSRSFLLAINVLTIAYSSFSENIVQIQSLLPSFASIGSLIGTVIAIVMSFAVIYLLVTKQAANSNRIRYQKSLIQNWKNTGS